MMTIVTGRKNSIDDIVMVSKSIIVIQDTTKVNVDLIQLHAS